MSENPKTRMLSPQARQAAIASRRQRIAAQPARNAPAVFIVRLGAGQDLGFGWEIRKFGSFVILKSNEDLQPDRMRRLQAKTLWQQ